MVTTRSQNQRPENDKGLIADMMKEYADLRAQTAWEDVSLIKLQLELDRCIAQGRKVMQARKKYNRVQESYNSYYKQQAVEAQIEDYFYYRILPHRSGRKALYARKQPDKGHLPGKSTKGRYQLSSRVPEPKWIIEYLEKVDKEDKKTWDKLRNEPVPPNQLFLFVPNSKRKVRAYNPNGRLQRNDYMELNIDMAALEKKRAEIEDGTGGDVGLHKNHSERRKHELAETDAMKTANMELIGSRNTRTKEGLWISAMETPDDWKTSYCRTRLLEPGSPVSSLDSSSSSSQSPPKRPSQRPPVESSPNPPGGSPQPEPNNGEAYDSDLEDPLYLEYTRLSGEIYGSKPTQGNQSVSRPSGDDASEMDLE